jgi:hypothetical protein
VQNDGTLYRRLVIQRGWSPAEFVEWLASVVRGSLLG